MTRQITCIVVNTAMIGRCVLSNICVSSNICAFLVGPQTTTHLYSVTKVGPSSVSCNKRKMLGVKRTTSRWPPVWETAVHLAVASGVFDGVFCAVLFPLDVLDEI